MQVVVWFFIATTCAKQFFNIRGASPKPKNASKIKSLLSNKFAPLQDLAHLAKLLNLHLSHVHPPALSALSPFVYVTQVDLAKWVKSLLASVISILRLSKLTT